MPSPKKFAMRGLPDGTMLVRPLTHALSLWRRSGHGLVHGPQAGGPKQVVPERSAKIQPSQGALQPAQAGQA